MRFDKDEIKEQITPEMVEDIVRDFGGDPHRTAFGFIAGTICHNHPGEGSHKLYYYDNTKLFRCYTGCDATFDIFELVCKCYHVAHPDTEQPGMYYGVKYVANKLGITGAAIDDDEQFGGIPDLTVFEKYDKIKVSIEDQKRLQLKEYDSTILDRLCYPRIGDWLDEGMTQEVLTKNRIGFCPSTDQITIPHYDKDGRFVGLRGRYLGKEQAELYGKYRPMYLNGQMYNHPLGFNLYNLNNSKQQISKVKKAIIFEGEKSCLLYQSYFGFKNDISVACCGSAVSSYQMNLLQECGATEIIIAFDRQFQQCNDDEFKHLVKNLKAIHKKYGNYVNISFIFDKEMITGYKDSPIDCGAETFVKLFKNRVVL